MKRRLRKWMSVLIVSVMLICLTNGLELNMLTAKAVTDSGACGPYLNWSVDTDTGVLAITGSGWMASYTSNSKAPWYNYRQYITSIELSDQMTSIGDYAFYECSNITGNLIIPDTVTSIGAHAFQNCSGFNGTLTIPNGVTTIDDYAFDECDGFTGNLTIPNSVTSIGQAAFRRCRNFNGTLTISNSVTRIGQSAFDVCFGFTGSLVIPGSVTSIGNAAFRSCTGFTGNLVIPAGVTNIGTNPFAGCNGITGISVDSGNSVYDSRNNCNAIIHTSANRLISGCNNTIIPDSVIYIGAYAFYNLNGFTGSLILSNAVAYIGEYAFYGCSGLTGVSIPESVTYIGSYVFYGCSGLSSITIPSSVTYSGQFALPTGIGYAVVYPDNLDWGYTGYYMCGAIYCNENSTAETFADGRGILCGRIGTADNSWHTCYDLDEGDCWQYNAGSYSTKEILYMNGQSIQRGLNVILEKSTTSDYDFQVKTPDFTAESYGKYSIEFKNLEEGNTQQTYIEVCKSSDDTVLTSTTAVAVNNGSETTYTADIILDEGDTVYVKYIERYASAGSRALSVEFKEPYEVSDLNDFSVEGFQIRTNDPEGSVAYRTICKAPNKGSRIVINEKQYTVADFGTIYSRDPVNRTGNNAENSIDKSYTVLDLDNPIENVQYQYVGLKKYNNTDVTFGHISTSAGILTNWNTDKKHTYYAATMQGMDQDMANTLFVRAFIITTDNKIIYTPETAVTSVAEIADYLYENSYANNYTAHQYLYSRILHNPILNTYHNIYYRGDNETVEYGWGDNLCKNWTPVEPVIFQNANDPIYTILQGAVNVGEWKLYAQKGNGAMSYKGDGKSAGKLQLRIDEETDLSGNSANPYTGLCATTTLDAEADKAYEYSVNFTSTSAGTAYIEFYSAENSSTYETKTINVTEGENIITGSFTNEDDCCFCFMPKNLPEGTVIRFRDVSLSYENLVWTPVTPHLIENINAGIIGTTPTVVSMCNLFAQTDNGAMSYSENEETGNLKIRVDEATTVNDYYEGSLARTGLALTVPYGVESGTTYRITVKVKSSNAGTLSIGYLAGFGPTSVINGALIKGENTITKTFTASHTYDSFVLEIFIMNDFPAGTILDFEEISVEAQSE